MGVKLGDPNHLRIDVDAEAGRAFLWLYGDRYELMTMELAHDPYFRAEYGSLWPNYPAVKVTFDVVPRPVPPPPPPVPRRRWSTHMGLRRPKQ
ncbi:hypothetical protein SEA_INVICTUSMANEO_79 [Mycobacterium phage InvictusManeo]|nr:hypothetical protein SEA_INVICTUSMANEO_79 [Mycobacterium phage InvictusManeo]